MRLSVIFVSTLAVSVILSSCATLGLTYSTSYAELRNMASGFVTLAGTAVGEFRQLVAQLISDSSALVSSVLATQYSRSMAQLNQTEQELYQTTLELMAQTKNATAQSQALVAALVVSFGGFMQSVIAQFTAAGTSDASGLRTESARRAQLLFNDMLQTAAMGIKRTAQLYDMGMVNLSRPMDQPLDDGSCTLMGALCYARAELGVSLYVGTAAGAMVECYPDMAANYLVRRGAAVDTYIVPEFPPFLPGTPGANFSRWKETCLSSSSPTNTTSVCQHGVGMDYPNYCNGTCGYDPRCRPWYSMFYTPQVPRTTMSDVYSDSDTGEPVVTLSFPLYSSGSQLLAVAATDFFLSDVDAFLGTLSASQLVAVVFNTSDLLVMGTSRPCPNATGQSASGKPIAAACDPALQALGGWLALNRNMMSNASLEVGGYLWDVFPGTVESFSYFVAVGMNKTQVYAVVTATSQAANQTLQTLSQQQTARMEKTEADSLAQMERLSANRIASLHAMESQYQSYMKEEYVRMDALFNSSRQQSAANLSLLTSSEMQTIDQLEDYHLTKVKNAIGVTFGAVVGIFAAVLLFSSYGTWAVTKQVERIAQAMEDVAQMRVEELKVTQKSPIREVQHIEASLVVLVARLAEYKTYMPAGLFQVGNEAPPAEEHPCTPPSVLKPMGRKRSLSSSQSSVSPHRARSHSGMPSGQPARVAPVAGHARLVRRSAVVMAVNVVRFQAESAQRSTGQLEGNLNKVIAAVHGTVSKMQGNIDTIVGDQLLVTFNAHFSCSDPSTVASTAALEVMATLRRDATFAWRVQIGLAAGAMYTGHLGNATFKSMVALGAPMKVASLLSHLSEFAESTVLVCPSLEERIKYTFRLQPVDLVALPVLAQFNPLYAKSITVFVLEDRTCQVGSQEWLYEVGGEGSGLWGQVFREVAKASSLEKAAADLARYIGDHPGDPLAPRLLRRLLLWQPRVGVVLAERPDAPRGSPSPEETVDLGL